MSGAQEQLEKQKHRHRQNITITIAIDSTIIDADRFISLAETAG